MLATLKGTFNNRVIVLNSKPGLKNGDEVVVTYEVSVSECKNEKKEWGFMKSNKYIKNKYGTLQVSDGLIEERESYR